MYENEITKLLHQDLDFCKKFLKQLQETKPPITRHHKSIFSYLETSINTIELNMTGLLDRHNIFKIRNLFNSIFHTFYDYHLNTTFT